MEISFEGRRALVTGAGKGLGRAIAKALWSAKAVTYALSRTQEDLDSLEKECPGIHTICLDLAADWTQTADTVKGIGHLDLLVNNAGVLRIHDSFKITEEDFDQIYDVNVKSVVNVTQVVAQGMVERKQGGAIVNVSGTLSQVAFPGTQVYGPSKAALEQLTRCMAVELGPHQIRVNAIKPTLLPETPMGVWVIEQTPPDVLKEKIKDRIPLGRVATLEDCVNATLYLLSDKAEMINGALLPVEGGQLCT